MSSKVGILACAALSACGAKEPRPDAGPPSVEIGTGESQFEPIRDGDELFIVQGPQDGYHFFGSLLAHNLEFGDSANLMDSDNPTTTFEVFQGTQRVDASGSTYRQGLAVDDGTAQMTGRTVFLDIEDDSELDGVSLRFVVSIEDAYGVRVSDERQVVGLPHPNNQ